MAAIFPGIIAFLMYTKLQQVVGGFSIESENFQSCKIKAVALQRVKTFQNWTDANNSKVMKPWKTISGQFWSSDI